jgi:phosphatidylglycerophosphate synthase
MEPIISPWLVYLVLTWSDILGAIVLITFGLVGLIAFRFRNTGRADKRSEEGYYDVTANRNRRTGIQMICTFLAGMTLVFLLPAKNTLIGMLVTNTITYDVAEKVLEAGKDLKNELKADIIEVFYGIEHPEEEETDE